jgi:CDP-glucose 4,6-dehydratase
MMLAVNPWNGRYRGRRVLVTGNTGFKGSWLSIWLHQLGANVLGYSLDPPTQPALFDQAEVRRLVTQVHGDVRDRDHLAGVWREFRPEIVFHLAAQSLVRASYRIPAETVTTNVLGTVNVMETARLDPDPVALVLITSDKCYENREWERGYAEEDTLGGRDIYSGSKAAAEVLIHSYRRSFFAEGMRVPMASARAGNVIGGGDWADDRIVPDVVRALMAGEPVAVRNAAAVRPWQHVLEPLSGYLGLGAALLERTSPALCTAFNFGPAIQNTRSVGELVSLAVELWGSGEWRDASTPGAPHEATLLRLDIARADRELGWRPRWNFDEAVRHTIGWYKASTRGEPGIDRCREQIAAYGAHVPAPSAI